MPDGIAYELARVGLSDGAETTVYLVRHPLADTSVRVLHFPEPARLDHWCAANDHPEAIVAGFFVRDPWRPLGEVRVAGEVVAHEPILGRWGPERACVHSDGAVRMAARKELPDDPEGDLVQAGPLLVSGGRSLMDGEDREGFSDDAEQFDSDITIGRHPRCALGVNETELLAVCCDGRRSGVDGGTHARRARPAADLLRRRGGDQPGRRRLRDARAPRAPAQSPLLELGSAGARVAADRHRAAVRPVGRVGIAYRVTVTRRNVAGIDVASSLVFCSSNRVSSSSWSSASRPFAAAASNAFMVGP